MIDYEVLSSTGHGFKTKGSVFIRGSRDQETGFDSFKFILEKAVDFNKLDSDLILEAIEASFKMFPPKKAEADPPRFSAKNKANFGNPMASSSGGESSEEPQDPASVLQKHGCSVFLPDVRENKLDWDYLAGYETVKRNIEDTVLLALTHGDVYDQITAATRMKNETNRPKCVLFEGPPGCGKTTSAKIISH